MAQLTFSGVKHFWGLGKHGPWTSARKESLAGDAHTLYIDIYRDIYREREREREIDKYVCPGAQIHRV